MNMPDVIDKNMFAPCGMNCILCYKHISKGSKKNVCYGCFSTNKPKHCNNCNIKMCTLQRGHTYCFECLDFPCKLIKNLEKSYNKKYSVSLIENSINAKEKGISKFLELDRKNNICLCGGIISLHDKYCSECGKK